MRELFAVLGRVSPTESAVLIHGEPGSGKELVAESIHEASGRVDGPFVVFDCGAAMPGSGERELFGPDSVPETNPPSRGGAVEQAHGGSLFLDEVGELTGDLQSMLLAVLQQREAQKARFGGASPVDFRVLASTSLDLDELVRQGRFLTRLQELLSEVQVRVPPLRDRIQDLPLLVEHFLSRTRGSAPGALVSPQVLKIFGSYAWPGNVRELAGVVQSWLPPAEHPLGRDRTADAARESSSNQPIELRPLRVARREASDGFERAYLQALLTRTDGNVTRAAAIAEVSRQMVQKLMRKHGLP